MHTTEQAQQVINLLHQGYVFTGEQTFAQCHASSLVHLQGDEFIVAWFGGTSEGNQDVAIWLARGGPGGWQRPVKVAKVNNQAHWNPVLFKDKTGTIHLFFKVGTTPSYWSTWHQNSSDNGLSWSEAKLLVKNEQANNQPLARGPVRSKPIILSNGSWLAGASDESQGKWNVFADASQDQGRSWQHTGFIPLDPALVSDRGVIQPTLWESQAGVVHMMTRSTEDVIFRSDSLDSGKTWSALYPTQLPNNNSAIDVVKLDAPSEALALVFNKLATDGIRTPINLALSFDNGQTWPHSIELEHQPGSEFSYPAIIQVGNRVYGTYTWNRKRIAFWTAEISTP